NVDQVASSIERLLVDRPLAARIAAAAAKQADERYSLEQMAANYQRHYDELLASCAGNSRRHDAIDLLPQARSR
ncbi:MAG TPA: hypothetical protein VHB99_08485, partial [Pirellulales bacterium]|nr:hypothetical protein [Pirellulales bacterium]